MDRHGVDHAGDGGAQNIEGVDLVKDRLLVLLEVTVVGERKSLEDGEEASEVADESSGLAARKLSDVRVLLLGHDRGPVE